MNSILLLAAFLLAPMDLLAAPVRTTHVSAELVAEHSSSQPGAQAWVGLRLNHDKHWHTYWKYPGDSGLPTKVKWELPKGWEISEIYWPIPDRILLLPLVNYGYEKEILLGFALKIPAGEKPGTYDLKANASWLVCKEECIPEKADLTLQVKVDEAPLKRNPWARLFDKVRAEQPQPLPESAELEFKEDKICLHFKNATDWIKGSKFDFYVSAPQLIYDVEPPEALKQGTLLTLCQKKANPFREGAENLPGILVVNGRNNTAAYAVDIPISNKAGISAAAALDLPPEESNFALIVFAFLGGLLLNLMPCVFPVLGIKIMSLLKQSGGDRWEIAKQGQAYSWGVIVSFWALTGLLLLLRSAGNSIGWGFQLQEPLFVAVLILLFSVMTANLLGLFEFSGRWMGMGSSLTEKEGLVGSFFTGVLAVVVATPCTAPFMGVAIGAALSKPAFVVFAVFTALGFGLAFPFFVLSFFPGALKKLPKPGMWMVRLKEFLAFPMAASVAWLLWVLSKQSGFFENAILFLGIALSVAFALVIWKKSASYFFRFLSLLLVFFSLYLLWPAPISEADKEWLSYSEETMAQFVGGTRPVFVDFTAAWCITCQVNKKTVLQRDEVKKFFAKNNVVLIEADWTNKDPVITKALEKYGRIGVPLYLSFAAGAKSPKILPQILTREVVEASLLQL